MAIRPSAGRRIPGSRAELAALHLPSVTSSPDHWALKLTGTDRRRRAYGTIRTTDRRIGSERAAASAGKATDPHVSRENRSGHPLPYLRHPRTGRRIKRHELKARAGRVTSFNRASDAGSAPLAHGMRAPADDMSEKVLVRSAHRTAKKAATGAKGRDKRARAPGTRIPSHAEPRDPPRTASVSPVGLDPFTENTTDRQM